MAQPSQNTSTKKTNVKSEKKKGPPTDYTIEDQGALLLYVDHLVKHRFINPYMRSYKNFLMVDSPTAEDAKYFVNYLFSPKKINKFLNASPLFFSSILPKARIYKVLQKEVFDPTSRSKKKNPYLIFGQNSKEERKSYTFLFPFEDFLSLPNKNGEISLQDYGKAYGAGVQSISIDDRVHQSTKAELVVNLKVLFSDFNIIFRKFVVHSEEDPAVTTLMSFKDLFNRDAAAAGKDSNGTNAELTDSSSFRIKLEIGWSYDEKLLRRINYGATDLKESDIQEIKFALQKSSYTYYLGHRSFELDLNTEGKITTSITYQGSIMMDFNSNEASVLYFTDPKDGTTINYFDLERKISEKQEKISKIQEIPVETTKTNTNKKPTPAEREKLKQEKQLEKLKNDTIKKINEEIANDQNKIYKEFMTNLLNKAAIYKLTIKKQTLDDLKKHFEKEVKTDVKVLSVENRIAQDKPIIEPLTFEEEQKQKDTSKLFKENLSTKKTKDNANNKDKIKKSGTLLDSKSDKNIYYVYLGDILEYAFGALKSSKVEEFGNTIPMVGPFTYSNVRKDISKKVLDALSAEENKDKELDQFYYDAPNVANLADIPISLERFKKFLFERFINSRVKVIKLDFFIEKLFTDLVFDGMSGNVFGAHMKKHFGALAFGSCTARTIPSGTKQKEFFTGELYQDIFLRKNFLFPFVLKSVDTDILFKQENANGSYLLNYYYIFADQVDNLGPTILKENERQQRGIVDIQIGAEKGIFKKVSFAKSQLGSALAPAAVINNRDLSRNNPLALSGMMSAEVEMFGNTFFSVSTKVHVDQSFLLNSPDARADEVIEFGLGGFYNVTKVSHDIEPGKFSTRMSIVLSHTNTGKKTSAAGSAETPKTINSSVTDRIDAVKKIAAEGQQKDQQKPPKINGKKA